MARLSYARVLVEVDILQDLRKSVKVQLPNGTSLCQLVIYETLPTHCKHCKVLSHSTGACKYRTIGGAQQGERRSVFSRLGGTADSMGVDTQSMFPEVVAGHEEWEVVRSKHRQKRKGVGRAHGIQSTTDTGAGTSQAVGSWPPTQTTAEIATNTSVAVARPSEARAEAADPAVICAAQVHRNATQSVLTDPTIPASGPAGLSSSGVGSTATKSVSLQVPNPEARFAETAFEFTSGADRVTGTAEVNDYCRLPPNVEHEMRGGDVCQGSLGSPFAGAARLGGRKVLPPDKGLRRDRETTPNRMVLPLVGGTSIHGSDASEGARESRVVEGRQEHGVPTRNGKRRARGGGKGIPSTCTD